MNHQNHFQTIVQPLPAGPLRNARIELLLKLDAAEIIQNSLQDIEMFLGEIEAYNDIRLDVVKSKLERQKKIKELLTLTYYDVQSFTKQQIKQTKITVQLLEDNRLDKFLRAFKLIEFFQDYKKKDSFWPDFTNWFTLPSFFKKEQQFVKIEKDKEQEQVSLIECKQEGSKKYKFKHD